MKEYMNVISTEYLFDEIVNELLEKSGKRMISKLDGNEIKKALYVPSITEEIRCAAIPMSPRLYSRYTVLFRVRKIDPSEYQYTIQDFWEPPKDVIKQGRLNKDGEQMLYCSVNDPITALKEARVKVGDKFIIIVYLVMDKISVNQIGFDQQMDILKTANKYFGKSGDSAYQLSEKLAKKLYRLNDCDGWCYPSVLHENGINLCFNLSAKSKLKLYAVHECVLTDENLGMSLHSVLDISDENSIVNLNPEQTRIEYDKFVCDYSELIKQNVNQYEKDNSNPQNHKLRPTVVMI